MQNPTRRRVLAAGLAGTALAVSGRGASAAAPPPGRPTEADVELLGFAQRLEFAAHDLYQQAIDAGAAGDTDRVLMACRDIHRANVDAYSAMLGTSASNTRDEAVFEDWVDLFSAPSLDDVAAAAYDFESVAAATHTDLLAELEGLDGATLVAAIVNTESRLCAVLADMSGRGDDFDAMFVNDADALSPATATATEG